MMAYEGSESTRDNFAKFIYQFQPETKTLIRKLERILNTLYRQNVSLLFYYLMKHTHTHIHTHKTYSHTHTHIYIYLCKYFDVFLLIIIIIIIIINIIIIILLF